LPSMCAALGLIPSSEKQKQKNRDWMVLSAWMQFLVLETHSAHWWRCHCWASVLCRVSSLICCSFTECQR
jgi:hypothetical protein